MPHVRRGDGVGHARAEVDVVVTVPEDGGGCVRGGNGRRQHRADGRGVVVEGHAAQHDGRGCAGGHGVRVGAGRRAGGAVGALGVGEDAAAERAGLHGVAAAVAQISAIVEIPVDIRGRAGRSNRRGQGRADDGIGGVQGEGLELIDGADCAVALHSRPAADDRAGCAVLASHAHADAATCVAGLDGVGAARAKARAHVVQPFIGDVCVCRIRGHGQGFAGPDRVLVQRCTADDRRLGGRQELGHHIAGVAVDADSAPRLAVLQHRHLRADAVGADDAVIRARARAHPNRLAVAGGHIRGVRAGRRGRGDVRHRQELRHHIARARANANLAPVRAADEHLYLRAHAVGCDDAVVGGRAGAHPDGLAVCRVDIRRAFGGGRAAAAARHGQVVAVHKAVMSIRREDIVPFAGCADDGHLRAGEVGGNRFGGCGSLRAQPQPSALNDCRCVILRTCGDNQHRDGNQHCQNQ